MAAVASNSRPEIAQEPQGEHFSEGGPSFTAVNGSTSPAPAQKAKDPPKENNEESNRPLRPSAPNEPNRNSVGGSQAPDPVNNSQHEQRPSPPQERTEDRPPPKYSHPHESVHEMQNHHAHTHAPPPPAPAPASGPVSQTNGNGNGVQKRKRSYPDEYDQSNTAAYHSHGLPPSPQRQRLYSQDNGTTRERDRSTPDNYGRPERGNGPELYPRPDRSPPTGNYPQPERHSLVRSDYDNRADSSIAPGRPYYSESHMAEVLQRENNSYEAMHENQFGSPDEDDDHHHSQQYGDYGGTPRTAAQREIDRTRRKRVFSNRTKTGCMTCRRRKKKCDEQHPECKLTDLASSRPSSIESVLSDLPPREANGTVFTGNNCLRGGFVCEGYTVRNTWQKPANTKVPIPLQSKNGGYPPQPMPRNMAPNYPRYGPESGPEYPGPPPPMGHGAHPAHHDGDRMKPVMVDDDRVRDYNEPNGTGKPLQYPKNRPYPSNPPEISRYEPGDERPGSNHDGGQYPPPPDANSMHPPPNVGRSNSVHSQYSTQSSQPPPHSSVQGIAQTALHLRPSPPQRRNDMTERDKMLKGNYYYPFSPALTQDRENCMAAVWRFNNATNPSHGASPEERQRRFREIMSCRPTAEPPSSSNVPQSSIMPVGRVGDNVVVEAPFHCDYGYNIQIGNDVLISADCRISDTCTVTIGDRCIFSPNVKLVCATYPIDPRRRQGSGGQALGRNIVIEEDCWIGSNVTILAGVRVGKSSTVGAGSLLHQVILLLPIQSFLKEDPHAN
ncbi:MAG: hypothetical protein LQ346_000037 [Caloplaca aetnensis]|nr:MAG: hypothetical protein LQ346_000037 [Caloplaca aetnensis]